MSKQPSPIPHDWAAAPCLDLVNSRWSDHLGSGDWYDRLPQEKFRKAFLKRWHLDDYGPGEGVDLAELARLRTFLRGVLERYAHGRPLTPSVRRRLQTEMNRAPIELQLRLVQTGVRLGERRAGSGWDVVMAEVATSAARLMSEGRTVKVCANPNCSWMFVDESRPRTRRWCNTGVCGSLMNVRRFRASGRRSRKN